MKKKKKVVKKKTLSFKPVKETKVVARSKITGPITAVPTSSLKEEYDADARITKLKYELDSLQKRFDNLQVDYDAALVIINEVPKDAFYLTRGKDGSLVGINMPALDSGFLKVKFEKRLSLYETAFEISDPTTCNKASEAIGKANMEQDSTALEACKSRMVELLTNQRSN